MKRVWPLTPRGIGAIVLAVVCFVVANQFGLVELVYFGILLVTMVVISFVSLYLARRTETVTRSFVPDVAAVGQDTRVTLQVSVRTALPTAPGQWRETLPVALLEVVDDEGAGAAGDFPALGSGLRGGVHTVEVGFELQAVRRGVHLLGPLQLVAADPFGLTRRATYVGERSRVVVAPEVVELSPLSTLAGDTGGTLHATTNQLGQGSDNLTPRRYVAGDSMRRIHWRATAHRDVLMVRQEEQESTPEASVVFDCGSSRWSAVAADEPGADPLFEVGVVACVSAVARLVREGFSVEIIDSDGTPLADPIEGGDTARADAMVTQFATLTARRDHDSGRHAGTAGSGGLDQLAHLFAGANTGPVVLITGRLDVADAASLDPIPHHTALPVLLAVAPEGAALDHAETSGWHAAEIRPGADLALAWSAVAERGRSDVRA